VVLPAVDVVKVVEVDIFLWCRRFIWIRFRFQKNGDYDLYLEFTSSSNGLWYSVGIDDEGRFKCTVAVKTTILYNQYATWPETIL